MESLTSSTSDVLVSPSIFESVEVTSRRLPLFKLTNLQRLLCQGMLILNAKAVMFFSINYTLSDLQLSFALLFESSH